jgi:hypothetical protein
MPYCLRAQGMGALNFQTNIQICVMGNYGFLFGHIKLGDDVGKLLLALVNHTQLQVGSHTPFFRLPYPSFAKIIDHTWVTFMEVNSPGTAYNTGGTLMGTISCSSS